MTQVTLSSLSPSPFGKSFLCLTGFEDLSIVALSSSLPSLQLPQPNRTRSNAGPFRLRRWVRSKLSRGW